MEGSRSFLIEYFVVLACACAFSYLSASHAYCFGGLFEMCSMYLLVCIVYTLPLVVLAFVVSVLSISFALMTFVLVAN